MADSFWCEVKLEVPAEKAELVAEIFLDAGAGGVVYDDPDILKTYSFEADEVVGSELLASLAQTFGIRTYLPVDDRLGERIAQLKDAVTEFFGHPVEFHLHQVQEDDWAQAWKAYFKPEHIGRVVIKPSWEDYSPSQGETIIELDPGMAFGTGTHPTTRLCLELLQDAVDRPLTVLDLGTGSGILAVAAAKLGAGKVVASDIDPLAVKVANENVLRNQVEELVSVVEGNLVERLEGKQFQLIVANIIADVIIRTIPELPQLLVSTGQFIASGIILERYPEVQTALENHGFSILQTRTNDGWIAVWAQKQD